MEAHAMGNAACCAGGPSAPLDAATTLHVRVELPWAADRVMLPLHTAARAAEPEGALWTTPVATLKRVLLAALKEKSSGESDSDSNARVYVALLACTRCGRAGGCRCGWRREHALTEALEERSLAQLLPRILPPSQLPRPASVHLRLFESRRPPVPWLESAIVSCKIVDPMVERVRAVYTIDVKYGERQWRVSRRFREFAKLHSTLLATIQNAEKLLPPPPPTTWFRHLDEEFLHQRQMQLGRYLRGLLSIDSVCETVALLSFLGLISDTQRTLLRSAQHASLECPVTDFMHLRVLQYYVKAGDVLLFQSRGNISAVQRSMTGSEWDHVAVVVPRERDDESKGFWLLEATGEGVTALPLTSRLYAYSAFHTSRVILRQLQTPLLSASVRDELLHRFTTRIKGLPYGLSVSKVLRTNESASAESHHQGDYFCSELAADAFKALGLIDAHIPSSNFWPSSFASGAFVDVELARHGASLGPAVAIDCRVLEVALATKTPSI